MTTRHRQPESSVKTLLTPRRRKRVVENDEYAAFARRVIRAQDSYGGVGEAALGMPMRV